MSTIKATVRNGRIELIAPDDLPDGTDVLVDVTPVLPAGVGIDETAWRDDPAALADWDAWIKTIEPLASPSANESGGHPFDEEFRRFNVEVVRKQMADGLGE